MISWYLEMYYSLINIYILYINYMHHYIICSSYSTIIIYYVLFCTRILIYNFYVKIPQMRYLDYRGWWFLSPSYLSFYFHYFLMILILYLNFPVSIIRRRFKNLFTNKLYEWLNSTPTWQIFRTVSQKWSSTKCR